MQKITDYRCHDQLKELQLAAFFKPCLTAICHVEGYIHKEKP